MPITRDLALFVIAVFLFLLGTLTFLAGLIVVLHRTLGKEVRAVSLQTQRLMQKGLTEEFSGLIGNVSLLVSSISEMVRTTTGTGLMVMVVGALMLSSSIYLIMFQIQWPLP